MLTIRRFFPLAFSLVLTAATIGGRAQEPGSRPEAASGSGPAYSSASASVPFPDDTWVPQGMDALAQHAGFHTDLTFDKQMLQMANGLTGDEETRQVIAKLRSISIHSYRYPEPGMYNPGVLDTVRAQYNARGWQHMVTSHALTASIGPGATPRVSERPGRTDVWIRFVHGNVEGMVLLVAGERNVNLVAVNGTLSPLDLLHLRGHFGIPRFSGDGLVPDNR
jgi:hypothetical protein